MKALVLKDYYTLARQMKFYLFFIVVIACYPKSSTAVFGIVYASMLPVTALAFDERSKWSNLALMMPYSVRSMVLSKYVIGYGCVIVTTVLSLISNIIISVVRGNGVDLQSVTMYVFYFCMGSIVMSIILPLLFRFGVEKGRLWLLVAMGITFGIGYGIIRMIVENSIEFRISYPVVIILTIIATILVCWLSTVISEHVYLKKLRSDN